MQISTLFFPALASFLLHVEAGPLIIPDDVTDSPADIINVRNLARPFSFTNLLIATYLFRRQFPSRQKRLHADVLCQHNRGRVRYGGCLPKQHNEWEPGQLWQCMLLHRIGTWFWGRNPTSDMSRPPSSLPSLGRGNANFDKNCPAVIPNCQDASCLGDPDRGCFGRLIGCNCTTNAVSSNQNPPYRRNATVQNTASEDPCPQSPPDCADSGCQSNAVGGGIDAVCSVQPFKGCPCEAPSWEGSSPTCPLYILCSDTRCQGWDAQHGHVGICYSANFSGCTCDVDSYNRKMH